MNRKLLVDCYTRANRQSATFAHAWDWEDAFATEVILDVLSFLDGKIPKDVMDSTVKYYSVQGNVDAESSS